MNSHSADLLNTSMVSALQVFEDEGFPPTQLSEKGDVLASLAQGHNEYRKAAFATPPSLEGANNQVFEDMRNPFTGAKKVELGVCYMCDEVIPRKHDTIALQPVPGDVPS